MTYSFHPEAATEYAEQVTYYKSVREGLGARFHAEVKAAIASICEAPARYRIEFAPAIRRARVQGFPYNVIFREIGENIQILAVAHHRRRPLYWLARL